ncbi:hypothetical protein Aperf_G00000054998 [Anoplocephala perfoliata]
MQTVVSEFSRAHAQFLANAIVSNSTEQLAVPTTSSCSAVWRLSSKMLDSFGSHFKLGSSVLFHVSRKLCIEFISGEGVEDSFKRRVAATLQVTCPSGVSSEKHKFSRLNVAVTGSLPATTGAHRKDLEEFYDAQIQMAEMLGFAAGFKFWLLRWFQHLVIEGMGMWLAGC